MLVCLSSHVINVSNSIKESYQLNLSLCSTASLFCSIRLALPGLWWDVPPKALKAIMVTLRCLEFSRVFSLLLFKIKYLFGYSSGQVGKFVSKLAISWEMFRSCRVYQLAFHLQLVFNKLPKLNSLLKEGSFHFCPYIAVLNHCFSSISSLKTWDKAPGQPKFTSYQCSASLHCSSVSKGQTFEY